LGARIPDAGEPHVMKLNYTSLQHAIAPVEETDERLELPLSTPVAVLALHGQLAALAWAFAHAAPGATLAYVQTAGGALAGAPTLLVARMSEADPRERHRGVSHHTRTVLDLLLASVTVALPQGQPVPDDRHDYRTVPVDVGAYPGPTTAMGREDPLFHASALA